MEKTKIKLPGYGLPLDQMPKWERDGEKYRFPHAIADYVAAPAITLRELAMLSFINQITEKPKWTEKVHNDKIVAKWRVEACGTEMQQEVSGQHLSKKCFDYVSE